MVDKKTDKKPGAGWRFKTGLVGRSTRPRWIDYINHRPQPLRREDDPTLGELYNIAYTNNAVRKSIQALKDYVFKEGLEWKPKYSRKCNACSHEFPPHSKPEMCVECGAASPFDPATGLEIPWHTEPDEAVTKQCDRFFKRVDRNGHTFIEMLKMFEEHLNIADDAFLVMAQDYELDEKGDIVGWTLREMTVPDPRNFRMVVDPQTLVPGGLYYICLSCRPTYRPKSGFGASSPPTPKGAVHAAPGDCPTCQRKLHDVWYISTKPGSDDQPIEYYIEREVIHTSKYSVNYGYGRSPLLSVYNMASTLNQMEIHMKTWYDEERVPRMAIFIPTRNPDSIREAMQAAEDRNVSQGGHYVPKFTYDPGDNARLGVEVHEFSKLPEELQYLEVRDEFYRRIGSAFGVSPVFHGNVDAVGLQNQGPTQWLVTTLAASWAQWVYNEKVLPRVLELLGVKDWELKVCEPEEEDEMQKQQVELMKLQVAVMKMQLGFQVKGVDQEGNIEFSEQPMQPGPTGMMPPGMEGEEGGLEGDPSGDQPPGGEPPPSLDKVEAAGAVGAPPFPPGEDEYVG